MSVDKHGPVKPKMYEMRPDAIEVAFDVPRKLFLLERVLVSGPITWVCYDPSKLLNAPTYTPMRKSFIKERH